MSLTNKHINKLLRIYLKRRHNSSQISDCSLMFCFFKAVMYIHSLYNVRTLNYFLNHKLLMLSTSSIIVHLILHHFGIIEINLFLRLACHKKLNLTQIF